MNHFLFKPFVIISTLTLMSQAQPITKNGNCGPLARTPADSRDNWNQYWGARPNPITDFPVGTIQAPLTPQQSANCTDAPPGLKLELWASEEMSGTLNPGLHYMQHFTFDERGRLWVVEPRSYPNIIRTASGNTSDNKFQGGLDRILILEDTNGDKVMDLVKVFKSGLNLPQSIEIVKGGVVVAMTPYLVYFPNNNDVAGPPEILFKGLGGNGDFDTHGGISSLMYGLDNWIYGHTGFNSNSSVACVVNGVNCSGGRVWRFRHVSLGHERTEFEVWTTGRSNAWGIGQMEDGQIFQSAATGGNSHISHSSRKGAEANDVRDGTGLGLFYPITGDRWLWEGQTSKNAQGWFASQSTAVSGLQFYTSRLLPQKYWNRFAFSCEGASKLCNQDSLVVSGTGNAIGSTWRAVRMPGPERSNLVASRDAWFAPILAKTGPDGAVWVLDWYNYLFLHNPASPMGPGVAWDNALRVKTRSRIWRVTPASGATEPVLNLRTASMPQLVAALANPNMHWRLQAQRLMIEGGWSAELGDSLKAILEQDRSVDLMGNNPRVVHALWTLHGLGRFESDAATWSPVLARLLKHPAWGVRRNVLRVMPRTSASATSIGEACSVNDPHGHVRLQALVAFSEISAKPAGLPPMAESFRNLDAISRAAFTASGITAAASGTCTPSLDPVTSVSRSPSYSAMPRSDLRFVTTHDGFRLQPHGQLPDGELRVSDISGRLVFRSTYQTREKRWSNESARGLKAEVLFYRFTGVDGTRMEGRISPVPSL